MRERRISLHGLGFVQVELDGGQRLHVWHPRLPRRRCFEHSRIHDHRWAFHSTVLVGELTNRVFDHTWAANGDGPHVAYLHDGPRRPSGNRGWRPDGTVYLHHARSGRVRAGGSYFMPKYRFHRTEVGGEGLLATIIRKGAYSEDNRAAHSLCTAGVTPDVDFDRFQLPDSRLWEVVREVLGGPLATWL
jgi:hypothetical protein